MNENEEITWGEMVKDIWVINVYFLTNKCLTISPINCQTTNIPDDSRPDKVTGRLANVSLHITLTPGVE